MANFWTQCITLLFFFPFQLIKGISYNGVTPKSPYIFIGDMLVLNCTVTDPRMAIPRSLYFTHNGSEISPRLIRRIDSRTIQLRMNVSSPKDAGYYRCFSTRNRTVKLLQRIIGSQFVNVEYKVQSVKNINCKVYDWQIMNCTWDLGADYIDKVNTNVSLGWTISKRQYDCPHQTPTSCTWQSGEGVLSFQPDAYYHMQITVWNRKKDVRKKSAIFAIDSSLIVQPAKLTGVTCQALNSTCIILEWSHPRQLMCRIQYHSNWDAVDDWKVLNATRRQVSICHLLPHSFYNVNISCLPKRTKTYLWSEVTTFSVQTPSEVPEKPPDIPGSYYTVPSTDVNKKCSDVVIYWKEVEPKYLFGNPQGYLIQYRPTHGNWQEVEIRQGLTSAKMCLSMQKAFEIRLYARNNVNFSTGYSTLFIETEDKRPGIPPNFTAEMLPNKGTNLLNITLSWGTPTKIAEGLRLKGYLLFWCHSHDSKHKFNCKDEANWIHLPTNVHNYSLVAKKSTIKNLVFAVATEASVIETGQEVHSDILNGFSSGPKNVSSGMVWSSCIYRKDLKPLGAPSDVRFGSILDRSLLVSWQPLACEESPTQIIEYLIYYCSVNSSQICYGATKIGHAKGTDSSYIIADLTPGLRYRVSLQAISPAGKGPETSPIFSFVIDERLKPEVIAAIAAAVCIIIIFLLIGCITVFKRATLCLKKYNEIEIEYHVDNLPSLPDEPLYYDDEFEQSSFRRPLPSAKSYDSDDRCSVHTQNSPTAETPLINEPKRRNKINKSHSPKPTCPHQPSTMDKRSSATWSPRSSANLEAIPTEYYLDGSRSSPVTLTKNTKIKQRAVLDIPKPLQSSMLDSYYNGGDSESTYIHDSIETIHPIKPVIDGQPFASPAGGPSSDWTSRSSLDTPSYGKNPIVDSSGNLVYCRTGLSSTTIASHGDALSTNGVFSPHPPRSTRLKGRNFSSQGSLDNVGVKKSQISLLDLQISEDHTDSMVPNHRFLPESPRSVRSKPGSQRELSVSPGESDVACGDTKSKELGSLSKIDEAPIPEDGVDCIALKTYKTSAVTPDADDNLPRLRLPEETNGSPPHMLNRFMAHHDMIPYHSGDASLSIGAVTSQEDDDNNAQISNFVRDIMKRSEDGTNDSADYYVRDGSSIFNSFKKKGHKRRKKAPSSNSTNSSSNSNNSRSSSSQSAAHRNDWQEQNAQSSWEQPSEMQTFVPPQTLDPNTYTSEELPPHFFMDPEITPDLPTTDL